MTSIQTTIESYAKMMEYIEETLKLDRPEVGVYYLQGKTFSCEGYVVKSIKVIEDDNFNKLLFIRCVSKLENLDAEYSQMFDWVAEIGMLEEKIFGSLL